MKSKHDGLLTWGTAGSSCSHGCEGARGCHWEVGKERICNTLDRAFWPGTNLSIFSRETISFESLLLGLCLEFWAYRVSVCVKRGARKVLLGATSQASSNAELLSGRSERRCGAHIHADRGLYALSSPSGSKNLKRSSGVWPPGPSKYTSKTVYQLIEQRAFLHPREEANRAHEFLIVAINHVIFFVHAPTMESAWTFRSTQLKSTQLESQVNSKSKSKSTPEQGANRYKFWSFLPSIFL
jgi:hypothetical protein